MGNFEPILNKCRTHNGRLSPDQRSKLARVLTEPTISNWQNARTVVIASQGTARTLLQAVVKVAPEFMEDFVIGTSGVEWRRIPDSFVIARAIRYATSKENNPPAAEIVRKAKSKTGTC